MAKKLTIWTYDWVPAGARGFVRDLRLRWAAEEASLAYDVRTVPFEDRETNHLDRQPFGHVPVRVDGHGERSATEAYVARVTARAAFRKAHSDQIAHFAAADHDR